MEIRAEDLTQIGGLKLEVTLAVSIHHKGGALHTLELVCLFQVPEEPLLVTVLALQITPKVISMEVQQQVEVQTLQVAIGISSMAVGSSSDSGKEEGNKWHLFQLQLEFCKARINLYKWEAAVRFV